jgi:DNA-binding SARP family transcriptional activator
MKVARTVVSEGDIFGEERGGPDTPPPRELFDQFPFGLMLVDRDGVVVEVNPRAGELLPLDEREDAASPPTCCELLCELVADQVENERLGCLTRRALEAQAPLSEVRVDVKRNGAVKSVWITAGTIDAEGSRLVFHLRPGVPRDRRRRISGDWQPGARPPELRVFTLGRGRVQRGTQSIWGEWLEQRPGQLLKYLVCERRRVVASDQIAEALWPGGGAGALNRVRHYVHVLRDKLEPERAKREPSRLVVARRGGYVIDRERVWIDADEFEDEVSAGLALFVQGEADACAPHLEAGLALYGGDFLIEDPYADWALAERDRLREIAGRALRALVTIKLDAGDLEGAALGTRRLAEMEPYDLDVQRDDLEMCMRRGRRSEAARRYELMRHRELRMFGREPDFELSDIAG